MEIIYDDAEVIAALQRLRDRVGDIRPALTDIGEKITGLTKHRFGNLTAPDGSHWAENSDVTIDRKGHDRPPLTGITGELMDDIHSQLDGAFGVEIGSNKDQATMMQFGGTKAKFPHLWGDIPARPFLGISEADKNEILTIIQRHLSV